MNISPQYNLKKFKFLREQSGYRIYKLIEKKPGQPGYTVIPPWGGIDTFTNFRKAMRSVERGIKRVREAICE